MESKCALNLIFEFLVTWFFTDEATKTDIINFLEYIEQRDFRFKMWRLVSLDIALPMNLANIITNYIIVMVSSLN